MFEALRDSGPATEVAPTTPQPQRVFIDRDEPLRELTDRLGESVAGHGRVFLLSGRMGMGKTWLLEEFARRARESGSFVAWGRASDDAGAPAFWPWIQVFRDLTGTALGRREKARIQSMIDGFTMPAMRASADARFRFYAEVVSLLRDIAADVPLVIALDDIHRADAASVDLVKFIADDWHAGRTLVVAAYRESEALADSVPGRAFREIQSHADHLAISPFTVEDVADFVEASTGVRCAPVVAMAIHKASSGNPRRVRENALLLRARGALGRSALTLEENATMLFRGDPADRARALGLLHRAGEITGAGEALPRARRRHDEAAIDRPTEPLVTENVDGAKDGTPTIQKEGDVWIVAYAGVRCRVRDSRGIGYLARLVSTPHVEVHVGELVDLPTRSLDGSSPVLDAKAKSAYRARLVELREELRESEEFNDMGRTTQLRTAIDALVHEFATALGLSGRDRRFPAQAERARVSVTKAIRNAIQRIRALHPSLGEHLDASVTTGYFCTYAPSKPIRTEILPSG